MSDRFNEIADEILTVVNKKRTSGKTPESDVWVATYLPNREQIAVVFGDREVSGSYVQKRFKKDDKESIISELEKLYGKEPRNHNQQTLGEDTVYDHSWYEVEDGDYPKRTKEGVMIKEEDLEETCSGGATCAGAVCEAPGAVSSVKKSVSKVTRAACLPKRKKKKMSESIDSILFKESILNDMPCETKIEGHQFKYFMNEGKWYLSADNCLVKTHDKDVMMETFDQIVDDEKVTTSLLEDYSCYEMELLMEDENNVITNPEDSDSPLATSPISNDLQQAGVTSNMILNKKVEDNEKERNNGQPESPESALEKQERQDYDKNELEKLNGKEVVHVNPDNSIEKVTLGKSFPTSNGKIARMYKKSNGEIGADLSNTLHDEEELV